MCGHPRASGICEGPRPRAREGRGAAQSRVPLAGVNPSHLMNLFTYEKGYCFVYYLSQLCGDPQRFDDFLRVSTPLPGAGPALRPPRAPPPRRWRGGESGALRAAVHSTACSL